MDEIPVDPGGVGVGAVASHSRSQLSSPGVNFFITKTEQIRTRKKARTGSWKYIGH